MVVAKNGTSGKHATSKVADSSSDDSGSDSEGGKVSQLVQLTLVVIIRLPLFSLLRNFLYTRFLVSYVFLSVSGWVLWGALSL